MRNSGEPKKLLKEKKILITGFLIFLANVAISALETGQERRADLSFNNNEVGSWDHLSKPLQIQQLLHEKNMGSGILLKGAG